MREAFLESEDDGSAYNEYSGAAADSPEIPLSLVSVDNTSNIHTEIGSEDDSGRKTIVTTVKTRIALLLDSAIKATSFCSMVLS